MAAAIAAGLATRVQPDLPLWYYGVALLLVVLLLALPWWRDRSAATSAEARRRAADAQAAKRLLARKCCRNCGTAYANQTPAGAKPEYKCSACGMCTRKPKLLIPGEPDSGGETSPGKSPAGPAKCDKPGEKKRDDFGGRQLSKARAARGRHGGPASAALLDARPPPSRRRSSRNASSGRRRSSDSGWLRRRGGPGRRRARALAGSGARGG